MKMCARTSVFGLSTQQGPELFGPSALSVDALLQHRHLRGLTAEVPLSLNERRHLRRLSTQSTRYSKYTAVTFFSKCVRADTY